MTGCRHEADRWNANVLECDRIRHINLVDADACRSRRGR